MRQIPIVIVAGAEVGPHNDGVSFKARANGSALILTRQDALDMLEALRLALDRPDELDPRDFTGR